VVRIVWLSKCLRIVLRANMRALEASAGKLAQTSGKARPPSDEGPTACPPSPGCGPATFVAAPSTRTVGAAD
jgi:hypothetical protein